MENKSILDQIITNLSAEEVARLNAPEIIGNLFSELNARESDVLVRRFGLHGKEKETLENIGAAHKLTRERIRQIEVTAIKKLRQLKVLESHVSGLKKVINSLIEEHGGLIEREYLMSNLVDFSVDGIRARKDDEKIHKSHFDFIISKLLANEYEKIGGRHFKESFKFKHQDIDHLEEIIEELGRKIGELNAVLTTGEIVELAKRLENFKKHEDRLAVPNSIDISGVLRSELFTEDHDTINANKLVYSLLKAAKQIEQNKFGFWGVHNWREIKPKTINDKIYLVLKNANKPMHFVEIADAINQIRFDDKKANPATVHNELILDNKYTLIGRGLYSLKEWGYNKGTVADVIVEILMDENRPLSKEEIIEKVLKKRMVKRATISLSLMNKEKFSRNENSKYLLKN